MAKRVYDETWIGRSYARLTVVGIVRKDRNTVFFVCDCACGVRKDIKASHVVYGRVKSCGACQREPAVRVVRSKVIERHGMSKTKTYACWLAMLARCYNPRQVNWPDYGGRGIKVCDRWLHSFCAFLEDMGERPPGMSIDRIDHNGGYSPDNCRWATPHQQRRENNSGILPSSVLQDIEEGLQRGESIRRLSARTGANRKLISSIKRGERWPTYGRIKYASSRPEAATQESETNEVP